MSDQKKLPSHTLSFAETQVDGRGQEKLGKPVEVATVWPRSNGKKGGMVQWHISPQNLGDGAWFLLDKERQQNQNKAQEKDAFDQVKTNNKEQGLSR
ncbi:hypothetical protein AB835_10875 [Candidatus Endobugula sertula]|uniref:Uncharacterized protein n=1 Tax=Candidatus Endobugula sertula TaxID=62101 RepID=A0A1D2QN92_9GAMM|nr:hypothetical protein AB835_10875 [Candidatus Endobugula sertula]